MQYGVRRVYGLIHFRCETVITVQPPYNNRTAHNSTQTETITDEHTNTKHSEHEHYQLSVSQTKNSHTTDNTAMDRVSMKTESCSKNGACNNTDSCGFL